MFHQFQKYKHWKSEKVKKQKILSKSYIIIMMPKVHWHCQAGVRCGSSSCRDQYGGQLVVASASLGSVAPAPAPPSHTMNHLMEDLACLATRRPRTRRGQPQPQQEEGRGGPVRGRRSRLQHSSTPHYHEVGVAAGRYRDRYTSVCCL